MDTGFEQFVIDQVTEAQTQHPTLELFRDPSGHSRYEVRVGFFDRVRIPHD